MTLWLVGRFNGCIPYPPDPTVVILLRPERMNDLPNKRAGMILFLISQKPRRFWQHIFRHVESPERDINTGKHHSKVLVYGLGRIRVMPAMLDRACENIAQRPESPSRVGVNEEIPNPDDHSRPKQNLGISSSKCADRKDGKFTDQVHGHLYRVVPLTGNPVQIFRAVMDGVNRPEPLGVETAVSAISPDVKKEQHGQKLPRKTHRRHRGILLARNSHKKCQKRCERQIHNGRQEQVCEEKLEVNPGIFPGFFQSSKREILFQRGEDDCGNYERNTPNFEVVKPEREQLLHGRIYSGILSEIQSPFTTEGLSTFPAPL